MFGIKDRKQTKTPPRSVIVDSLMGAQRVTPQCKGDPGALALGTAKKVVLTLSKAGKNIKLQEIVTTT